MRDLINQTTKTKNVVLALTELSILFKSQKKSKSDKNFIDTLSVLAEAIGDMYTRDYFSAFNSNSSR